VVAELGQGHMGAVARLVAFLAATGAVGVAVWVALGASAVGASSFGVVSVGQVGVEQSLRCGYACIVPGSLLDCRSHQRLGMATNRS
jgi:hypothetical protein